MDSVQIMFVVALTAVGILAAYFKITEDDRASEEQEDEDDG